MNQPPFATLQIGYVEPLRAAWRRTREMLFHPVKPRTWLVLGFAAWLAGLMEGTGGGPGNLGIGKTGGAYHPVEFLRGAWQRLLEHPWLAVLIVVGAAATLLVLLLLLWISSRAKFVYLDSVITRRPAIVEPWRRTRQLGNSLFLWRLGFFAVALLAAAALGTVLYVAAGGLDGFGFATARSALMTVLAGAAALLLVMALALVTLFLDSFVVPLMAHGNLRTSAAWAAFLPWLEAYTGSFVLYGLAVLALWIGVALAVTVAGFATCCMVFFLLAVPYVGTVVLLPVHLTYRLFSLAFLAQFDPGLDMTGLRGPLQPSS
ncbi:MAG: hypothetical protein HRF46_11790 [Acidobacteriota bacterium]|jgi:hypothetical protein